jgi:diacylglycerol kinase (ATP)
VNHPAVEYIQSDRYLIEKLSDGEMKVDYDGEELMTGFPLVISLLPGAVTIIVPNYD